MQTFIPYLRDELRYSPATISAYERDIQHFDQFLSKEGLVYTQVNKQNFRFYLQQLKQEGISSRSTARKISAIKHYFRFLVESGQLDKNKIEDISLPVQKKRLPKVLYQEELQILLEAPRDHDFTGYRLQCILELLYGCGIRVSELVQLKMSDIHFSEELILVHGKGNKERYVPIGSYAIKAIEAYIKTPEFQKYTGMYLLINQQGERLSDRGVRYLLSKEAKRLNLSISIHPHIFRHTFATDMLNEGANLREVQEMLGHAQLSSTQVYTHVSTAKLQNAYLHAHPRAKKK